MSIKEIPSKVKNHIYQNRGTYAFVAGTFVMFAAHRYAVRNWDEFLDEQGIDHRDFYTPDWRDSTV